MKKINCILSLTICLGIGTTPAMAMEKNSGQISKDYVAGFLAGARLTDGEIIEHIKKTDDSSSGFLERAFKTRLGKQPSSVPATYYAGFCIPDDKPHASIVNNIIDQLKLVEPGQNSSPESMVYRAVKMRYPCNY
ncbi:hypothetical protein [Amphritea balenae]|uniref:Rap1a immunity protein domain-containing protein n=1 Tax=Amphritea balenae TaxID=452629 RepID=A0A3P1SWP0_9GAMM|nr:hypothetical protein [Amphritea balenae]RRD01609.1 hypothetical protein EHS89_03370 [Amphritea balenae]GGK55583.1 hypothetical protein GCM10007941_02150 [Amphritea balenae]